MKNLALVFLTAVSVGGCASGSNGINPLRDFSTLSVGEKLDFAGCTAKTTTEFKIYKNRAGTFGGVVDGTIEIPGRLATAAERAAYYSAFKDGINPWTVPGLRPD